MKTLTAVLMCICMFIPSVLVYGKDIAPAGPAIQIALLLDTSNSMDGLIGQAKTQLWKIVNEFATTQKNGQKPVFQVALYEYGNDRISAGEGHIRMVLPLTDDLDKVSEELFGLTTCGGNEYCGRVIKTAAEGLAWSSSTSDLKAVFIAGNEPFTQGDVNYKKAVKYALSRSITISTIFCGSYDQGVSGKWKDGADLADGSYINIDQSKKGIHIAAPQDRKIARLGVELNKTYIGYGRKAEECAARQKAQDKNAATGSGGAGVQRAVAKSSRLYKNAGWDLVDGVEEKKVDVEKLKDEELPENMRKMTPEERKAYIEKMAEKRKEIRKKIQKLNEARKKYVAEKMKELSEKGADTLDGAMIHSLKKQAESKGFTSE